MRLKLAKEVGKIASDLIYSDADSRHSHLRSVRMRYLFIEEARVKNGIPIWGVAARLAAKTALYAADALNEEFFADPADCECFELIVAFDIWQKLDKIGEQQGGKNLKGWLVNHLLSYCVKNEKGKMIIVPPDVRLFYTDAELFDMPVKDFRAIFNPLEVATTLAMDFSDEGSTVRDEDLKSDPNAPKITGRRARRARGGEPEKAGAIAADLLQQKPEETTGASSESSDTAGQNSDGTDESDDAERSELAIPLPTLLTGEERLAALEAREEERAAQESLPLPEGFPGSTPGGVAVAAAEAEDDSETPPEVSGFLERNRQAEIGATEEDVPMVVEARRRSARSSKDSEVAG